MTTAARRGANGEREAAKLIAEHTGENVKRRHNLGTHEDIGDIIGVTDTTIQVKNYKDVTRALNDALNALPKQQAEAGTKHGIGLIRRPGARWVVVMTIEQWAAYHREATNS